MSGLVLVYAVCSHFARSIAPLAHLLSSYSPASPLPLTTPTIRPIPMLSQTPPFVCCPSTATMKSSKLRRAKKVRRCVSNGSYSRRYTTQVVVTSSLRLLLAGSSSSRLARFARSLTHSLTHLAKSSSISTLLSSPNHASDFPHSLLTTRANSLLQICAERRRCEGVSSGSYSRLYTSCDSLASLRFASLAGSLCSPSSTPPALRSLTFAIFRSSST